MSFLVKVHRIKEKEEEAKNTKDGGKDSSYSFGNDFADEGKKKSKAANPIASPPKNRASSKSPGGDSADSMSSPDVSPRRRESNFGAVDALKIAQKSLPKGLKANELARLPPLEALRSVLISAAGSQQQAYRMLIERALRTQMSAAEIMNKGSGGGNAGDSPNANGKSSSPSGKSPGGKNNNSGDVQKSGVSVGALMKSNLIKLSPLMASLSAIFLPKPNLTPGISLDIFNIILVKLGVDTMTLLGMSPLQLFATLSDEKNAGKDGKDGAKKGQGSPNGNPNEGDSDKPQSPSLTPPGSPPPGNATEAGSPPGSAGGRNSPFNTEGSHKKTHNKLRNQSPISKSPDVTKAMALTNVDADEADAKNDPTVKVRGRLADPAKLTG